MIKPLILAPLALLVLPSLGAPALAETVVIKEVAGLELGERLSKTGDPAALSAAPQVTPVAVDDDAPPTRAERKVRVVYPLPR